MIAKPMSIKDAEHNGGARGRRLDPIVPLERRQAERQVQLAAGRGAERQRGHLVEGKPTAKDQGRGGR